MQTSPVRPSLWSCQPPFLPTRPGLWGHSVVLRRAGVQTARGHAGRTPPPSMHGASILPPSLIWAPVLGWLQAHCSHWLAPVRPPWHGVVAEVVCDQPARAKQLRFQAVGVHQQGSGRLVACTPPAVAGCSAPAPQAEPEPRSRGRHENIQGYDRSISLMSLGAGEVKVHGCSCLSCACRSCLSERGSDKKQS